MAEPLEPEITRHGLALEALRPPGLAWTTDAASVSRKLYEALGTELARLTGRAADLVAEADPRTTTELIEQWERILDLPGPCDELAPSLLLRQYAVYAKLVQPQGQSPQHFIDLASGLGFEITIEEYQPFVSGAGTSGALLSNGDWVFTWTVHAPELGGQWAQAGVAQAGEALLELNQDAIECFLEASKPAHTQLLVEHDQPWSGYAPWHTLYPDPATVAVANPTAIIKRD